MKDYIAKCKKSAVMFNTPAFWNCHGWKLGEYLALGKCILSTKLSNDLPAPLQHGSDIHIVEPDKEAIKDALQYLIQHDDYRHTLENNAQKYWEQYGTPIKSLALIGIKIEKHYDT